MLNRVINFDKKDWKHIFWLFVNMNKQLLKMNFSGCYECWTFIKLHLTHDSNQVEGGKR